MNKLMVWPLTDGWSHPRTVGYLRIELDAQKAVGAWVAGLALFAFA